MTGTTVPSCRRPEPTTGTAGQRRTARRSEAKPSLDGDLGVADIRTGEITIQRGLAGKVFEETLRHETVHSPPVIETFERERARVFLASTAQFAEINARAIEMSRAAWRVPDWEEQLAKSDGHVLCPFLRNGDGTLRCYAWIAIGSPATRTLVTIDVEDASLHRLKPVSEQGLRHLVNVLLGSLI